MESLDYLDPATLAAIDPLELRARMVVEGLMTGLHRSPYQGFNVEFAQHRQYTPGDDLRGLDWKVYGRTDKLYLKQYQQETNLDLLVLVDASGSMGYGSGWHPSGRRWSKYDLAASVAAAVAYMALRQQDRVGLALFADEVLVATRPSNAHDQWRSIVESLASHAPQQGDVAGESGGPGTDLKKVLDQTLARLPRRSLIVLVSDLFDTQEVLERAMARVRFSEHDLIVMQTLDPAELSFPFRGSSRFVGLEGEGDLNLDPPALRDAYLQAMKEHLDNVQQTARRYGFDYLLLDSSASLRAPLSRFLARRAAALPRGK